MSFLGSLTQSTLTGRGVREWVGIGLRTFSLKAEVSRVLLAVLILYTYFTSLDLPYMIMGNWSSLCRSAILIPSCSWRSVILSYLPELVAIRIAQKIKRFWLMCRVVGPRSTQMGKLDQASSTNNILVTCILLGRHQTPANALVDHHQNS